MILPSVDVESMMDIPLVSRSDVCSVPSEVVRVTRLSTIVELDASIIVIVSFDLLSPSATRISGEARIEISAPVNSTGKVFSIEP
ncbi:hypothetical protein ES708_34364 [subsurface metagenome]